LYHLLTGKMFVSVVDIIYPDDHREDDGGGMHDDRQCDNPECLCNVKEEIEEMQQYDPPI
jgi:hypothetical protein